MIGNLLFESLVFVAALLLIVVLVLAGPSLLRTVVRGPFGRFVLRPIYIVIFRPLIWLLRRIARIGRSSAQPLTREAQGQLGAVPYSAMAQMISVNSIAQQTLGDVPPNVKAMLKRSGWPFRMVDANAAAVSLSASLNLDDAKRNLQSAHHYYKEPMGTNFSPVFLYEDSEEALIIRILKDVDLPYFYSMRRINRNIRRNITKIFAIATILVSSFPFAANLVLEYGPAELTFKMTLFGGTILGYALLLWLFRTFYGNATRVNAQSVNYFMQTYFDRLLNQYKSADAQFESVPNDRTSDLGEIQQVSGIWFINLHWLAARQWFLDLYARNMIFQIVRNSWLSWFMVPVYFALAAAIYWSLSLLPVIVPTVRHSPLEFSLEAWKIYAPFAGLLLIYWWSITGLLNEFWTSVNPTNWSGFRAMDVDGTIERHTGRNVLEIVDKRRKPYGTPAAPYAPPPGR